MTQGHETQDIARLLPNRPLSSVQFSQFSQFSSARQCIRTVTTVNVPGYLPTPPYIPLMLLHTVLGLAALVLVAVGIHLVPFTSDTSARTNTSTPQACLSRSGLVIFFSLVCLVQIRSAPTNHSRLKLRPSRSLLPHMERKIPSLFYLAHTIFFAINPCYHPLNQSILFNHAVQELIKSR
ncbi:hypothetical protein EDB82DRAFT_271035 [Fusarium venenatum]|uniref:uncharacterized protein n=1 Tax=Fusarium venenatum TaxID=56646 RepID=UPI001E0BE154|nr:hypothetical protein EDB82DRAFT_271035 [Fusarium venenatum]